MANKAGRNVQASGLSELAFQLHDLKQLTEQLSNLAEAMQQASPAARADGSDAGSTPYYSSP